MMGKCIRKTQYTVLLWFLDQNCEAVDPTICSHSRSELGQRIGILELETSGRHGFLENPDRRGTPIFLPAGTTRTTKKPETESAGTPKKPETEPARRTDLVGVQVVTHSGPGGGVVQPDDCHVIADEMRGLGGVVQEFRNGSGHHGRLDLRELGRVDGGLAVLGGNHKELRGRRSANQLSAGAYEGRNETQKGGR